MEDASDEVYDYILTCICPVDLSKPGLSYNAVENTFQNRIRDWVVGMPDAAFLFPAFNAVSYTHLDVYKRQALPTAP